MYFKAGYGDLTTTKSAYQFQSPSDSYIQAELLTRNPKVGKQFAGTSLLSVLQTCKLAACL